MQYTSRVISENQTALLDRCKRCRLPTVDRMIQAENSGSVTSTGGPKRPPVLVTKQWVPKQALVSPEEKKFDSSYAKSRSVTVLNPGPRVFSLIIFTFPAPR